MNETAKKVLSGEFMRIRIESGPHRTQEHALPPGRHIVGRSPESTVALPHDLAVSPRHCELNFHQGVCNVVDLRSRAGTRVNGDHIAESVLKSGDRIQIGLTELSIWIFDSVNSEKTQTVLPEEIKSEWPGSATTSERLLDIPGYQIRRKIGEGGMGIVFEAERLSDHSTVAIKMMIPGKGTPQQAIDLFQREMKVLADLQHPHIVQFLDAGAHAGQIYLVMEYVETVSLSQISNELTENQRIRLYCGITCQILSALAYAHERKLVHRDVKPGNILVTRTEKRISAKLADFGLAKNFEQAGLSQLTGDDEIRGTPAYMPLEQFQNSRYAKPAVDLYSTAATLFYFLTGKTPGHTCPEGNTRNSLRTLVQLFTGRKPRSTSVEVSEGLSQLPESLAKVLHQGLASHPADRYPTATAMREALLPFCRITADL
ncbi:MAG: protein kinase [Planctomyces sp.]|nr:protein kinase [Planctomyces sp.]